MTQEDKDLLYTDLCARLPFKVKVEAKGLIKTIADEYDDKDIINAHILNGLNLRDYWKTYSIDCIQNIPLFNRRGDCNIKPYLFPLSSMTEEQQEEFDRIYADDMQVVANNLKNRLDGKPYETNLGHYRHIDWLTANHFDYRGLIPKGLAIDVTGLNIY